MDSVALAGYRLACASSLTEAPPRSHSRRMAWASSSLRLCGSLMTAPNLHSTDPLRNRSGVSGFRLQMARRRGQKPDPEPGEKGKQTLSGQSGDMAGLMVEREMLLQAETIHSD